MIRLILLVALVLVLTACSYSLEPLWSEPAPEVEPATAPVATVLPRAKPKAPPRQRFNRRAAAFVLKPGTSTLSGWVAPTKGTQLIVGIGATVRLIPVTHYATSRMVKLFGASKVYFTPREAGSVDPEYPRHMLYAYADADGYYTFKNVASGRYYVFATSARTRPDGYFGVMEIVTLITGQSLTLDLDGE